MLHRAQPADLPLLQLGVVGSEGPDCPLCPGVGVLRDDGLREIIRARGLDGGGQDGGQLRYRGRQMVSGQFVEVVNSFDEPVDAFSHHTELSVTWLLRPRSGIIPVFILSPFRRCRGACFPSPSGVYMTTRCAG